MPRYLISFDAHAMDHIPDEDMPAERSPTARTRRQSADSVSWTYAHVRRRWSGLPGPRSPAAVLKRSGSSCPTRP